MNKENLLKMADYIETIPQEQFDMKEFRTLDEDRVLPECNSVGCIIGHCTALDADNLPRYDGGKIDFNEWGQKFTEISRVSDDWYYLFSSWWKYTDNTPTGAAKRIRHYVENGLPEDWEEQIYGEAPLSYL